MKLNEYQEEAKRTAIYPGTGMTEGLNYTVLGLTGEAGELANKWKKFYRDGKLDPVGFAKELGDVLWYVACMADELGYTLEDIAMQNISKLQTRKMIGTLNGEGDNR